MDTCSIPKRPGGRPKTLRPVAKRSICLPADLADLVKKRCEQDCRSLSNYFQKLAREDCGLNG